VKLSIRVWKNEDGVDLKTWVSSYRAREKRMASQVKNNLHRIEIETSPVSGRSGVRGFRTLFGSGPDPILVTYFFQNFEGNFVHLDLFSFTDEAAAQWKARDVRTLQGLHLWSAAEARAAKLGPTPRD